MNHRDLNERLAVARQDFIIFRMAPKIQQPGKGPLDDPAARHHGKFNLKIACNIRKVNTPLLLCKFLYIAPKRLGPRLAATGTVTFKTHVRGVFRHVDF